MKAVERKVIKTIFKYQTDAGGSKNGVSPAFFCFLSKKIVQKGEMHHLDLTICL